MYSTSNSGEKTPKITGGVLYEVRRKEPTIREGKNKGRFPPRREKGKKTVRGPSKERSLPSLKGWVRGGFCPGGTMYEGKRTKRSTYR